MGQLPKIPDHRVYKVENVPELMAVQRALAEKGLKDPWLRNEVWRYDQSIRGSFNTVFMKTFGRGMVYGLAAAVITTAIGKMLPDHHHKHDDAEGH